MQLKRMVEKELEVFRKECNFTEQELTYFNLKAKGKYNFEIAQTMGVSEGTVSNLAREVKSKMKRVL